MQNKVFPFLVVLLWAIVCLETSYAEYYISNSNPINYNSDILKDNHYINHNYGEYRGQSGYFYHDGMDYYIPYKERATHSKIYPVASGTVHIHPQPDSEVGKKKGWGNCVIVDHGLYQTRYAHLSSIEVIEGQSVDASTVLGLSGNTGASDYEHLHFGIGNNGLAKSNLATVNTENPILAGLKQPKYGELNINPSPKGFNIRLLATGKDGSFGGENEVILANENEVINIPKPGQVLKAVIEAYHFTGRHNSVPYQVEFEVEKVFGKNDFIKVSRTITFDNMANIAALNPPPFSFSMPYVTNNIKDFYGVEFIPTAGKYKITAKIYSCYRNDSGFHLSSPEIAEREITVGLNGEYVGDLDWYDPDVSVAWLPDDIAGDGIMVAAAAPRGGVRATAVAPEGPKIFYAFANNNIITTNLLDVDQNLQKNVIIESRTKNKSNWTIRFFNSSGAQVDEKKINSQDWLRYEWPPSIASGIYTFNITAQDISTGGISTYESYDSITIDNTKPIASISMIKNTVSASGEIISAKISPSEDLYSMIVNVVKNSDYSVVQENVYSNPSMKKDQEDTIEWEDAYAYPDGWYNYEIVMTDLAGNIAKYYSPIMSVNKTGGYVAPPTTEVYNPTLPTPPPWPDRPRVSDIAIDSNGDQYVLYGRYNKVVKYNANGDKLIEKTTIGGASLFIPLGLSISADKVYISDSYNIRVLVCDKNLNYLNEIRNSDVYATLGDVDSYSWRLIFKETDYSNDAGGGIKKLSNEQYGLPEGIAKNNNSLFVIDRLRHRLLKYDLNGNVSNFSLLKANLREEARAAYNRNWTFNGQTVERALFWSNSLNDSISFDPHSLGRYYGMPDYEICWMRPMYLHSNIAGNSNGQLSSPQDVALNPAGDVIYVCDTANNRIQKFAMDGSFVAKYAEGRLSSPKGITVDGSGNIWVADTGSHRIVQFNSAGDFIKEYRSEDYEINPQKILVKGGKLYIADANYDKPLVWDVSGYIADAKIKNPAFSPNGDGKMDTNKISYALSQPAKISIQAINSIGEVVGTILSESPRNIGMNEEVWDGTIDTPSGSAIIQGGSYNLKIIASFGDYIKSTIVPVIVDTIPPTINLIVSVKAISPNGLGGPESTIFTYNITDDYSATVEAEFGQYKNGTMVNYLWDKYDWQRNGRLGENLSLNWDGKIGVDKHISQGKYLCKLSATDQAGNTGYATCEVLVDITAPRIENISIDNPYFSPNNDGRKDNAVLTYQLNDNLSSTLKVATILFSESGQEIGRIRNDQIVPVGEQTITWYGRVGSLESNILPDGKYSIRLWAFDEAGNMETKTLTEINIDTIPPTIQALSVSPNPFTPNNDGVKDTADFTYKLSEPCFADLRIFREDGVLFRNIGLYNIENNSWTWDGKGARGELLGGPYTYYLYAEDRAANITTSEVKTVLVDREPSLIPYCYAEPDPFSPVSQNNKYTDIKYWVSRDNVQVQVSVMGKEGQIIKNLVFGETQNKGEHIARWYGDFIPGYDGPKSDTDNNRVADGAYTFKIWAYDPYNSARGDNSNTVMADNTPPYLAIYPVQVDQVHRSATLRYYLPEIATVEVAAYDEKGILTESIINRENQQSGDYYVPWQVGNRSPGKTYFMVAAEDAAKNRDIKTTELFAIDPESPLAVSNASCFPSTFTPNSDGINDQARISYRLSGGVAEYRVDVNILNSSGATIKRLLVNEPQNTGTYNFYWNGKIDLPDPSLATVAADGHYSYQIIATDRLGVQVEVNGLFTLVATKPQVTLSANPIYLSPNGDGVADRSVLTYGIDYPAAWVENPARVRLDIVNSSGEAVFTKQFIQTPGTYTYEWDNRDGGDLGSRFYNLSAGYYYVYASATDGLGTSAVPASSSLYLDYSDPLPSNFNITPSYAKLGRQVNIDLIFTEALSEPPAVSIIMADSSIRSLSLQSVSGEAYRYSYTISAGDVDGVATVRVEARDVALNPILQTKSFTVDKNTPVISNVSISPNPAKAGNTNIDFKVNEDLGGVSVLVKQNGASALYAPLANLGSGSFRATYPVFSGYDGPASVTIEVSDLAGNSNLFTPSGAEGLIVDTTAPAFTSLNCQVDNPDFSTYAKEGSVVALNFKSSEPLAVSPDVKMNGRPMTFDLGPVTGNEYRYKYTIKNDDLEGLATLAIAGYDPAGNLGEKSTSDEADSFHIDLTNPTVAIANPGSMDIIASPSPFFTNADPEDTADRPNYTTLRYALSEAGLVTLRVHKVPDAQLIYSRSDFTDANLVATLKQDSLMSAGVQNTEWRGQTSVASFDANHDGYADKGKYAFIVDVKDKAGNLTQRKWGGTVWIQNNVLDLIQPTTIGINPDPLNFSPNGNSPNKTTKFWFMVTLSVTPETASPPERIEVMGIPETKRVGTYTVKVFDSGGVWVRTIVKDKYMLSSITTYEVWDGKNGSGPDKLLPDTNAPDGNYKISLAVKDFASNYAASSPLERWVRVDCTAPTITDNQSGDDTWRNSSGTVYNVDFVDNGSKLQDAAYKIIRPDTSQSAWIVLPITPASTSFADNWPVDWAQCSEGDNKVSVKVKDIAGNESLQDNIFYIRKDTVKPANPTLSINGCNAYTNSASVNLSASVVEGTSGIGDMQVRNSDSSYVHFTSNPWSLSGSDGTKTVYAKFIDNAGNWSDETSDTIVLDTTAPSISPPPDSSFNPYLGNLNLNFNVSDALSNVRSVSAQIEKSDGTLIKTLSVVAGDSGYTHKIIWNGINSSDDYVNEGSYRLKITASDYANNYSYDSNCDIVLWDDQRLTNDGAQSIYPDIAADTSGIHVVWQDNRAWETWQAVGTSNIYYKKSTDGGITWTSDSKIYSWYDFNIEPSIAVDGNYVAVAHTTGYSGTASVAWLDSSDGGNTWSTHGRAMSCGGQFADVLTHPYFVGMNQSGSNYNIIFNNCTNRDLYKFITSSNNAREPSLASFGQNVYVAWNDFSNSNTYFRSSTNEGVSWSGITSMGGYQNPSMAVTSSGKIYIAATQYNSSTGMTTIYPLFSNDNGNSFWFSYWPYIFQPVHQTAIAVKGDTVHIIFGCPAGIHYMRYSNGTWSRIVKISNSPGMSMNIAADLSNAYVTWTDERDGNREIYFQKIPINFAPVKDTMTASVPYIDNNRNISLATPEAPSLVEPADGIELKTTRPAFKWKAPKDIYTEYRVQWAQLPNAEGDGKATKNNTSGSEKPAEAGILYFGHQVDDHFDTALERNKTYFWKVVGKKADGTEIQSNNIYSFTCNPPLELQGITNYPNPFDPTREKTKIRYKLTKDADEVRIRIYDITGSLVTELDGTALGESLNLWTKYNDIEWDGRNGRGDLVMNGIYPFEVVARLGSTSVSGRGKIAVLK